jgi:hypothetical protein
MQEALQILSDFLLPTETSNLAAGTYPATFFDHARSTEVALIYEAAQVTTFATMFGYTTTTSSTEASAKNSVSLTTPYVSFSGDLTSETIAPTETPESSSVGTLPSRSPGYTMPSRLLTVVKAATPLRMAGSSDRSHGMVCAVFRC